MGDRGDRFRRLRTSKGGQVPADDDAASGTPGDLFEHFGVAVGPAAPPQPELAVEAAGCRRCGWLLAYRRDVKPCPMCGDAEPLTRVEDGSA